MKYPITICMAGAVSAGAYTAGVMAELLHAIRLWKESDEDLPMCPTHEIEIRGCSGASAGSIQAVLSTLDSLAASDSQELGRDAWFKAKLDKMLDLSDLKSGQDVHSVLNSDSLKDIANSEIKKHRWADSWPDFMGNPFEVRLSVTNLRGVPYKVNLPADNVTEFGMSTHNEYLRYCFSTDPNPSQNHHNILFGTKHQFDYERLVEGALASSAFPLAFSPIELKRPRIGNKDFHSEYEWLCPTKITKTQGGETNISFKSINRLPAWNEDFGPTEDIVAVDGGATNNEPVLEAFKLLFGDEISDWQNLDINSPPGRVLMIDPFPNAVDRKIEADALRIDNALGKLISALIGHARFSEPLMVSEGLQNRVGLVYPALPERTGDKMALRSGAIGGFTGFLKEDFLKHDYALGRLNMRRFLRFHFTLPIDNELFDDWRDNQDVLDAWTVTKKDGSKGIPIIPVYEKGEDGDFKPFSGGAAGEEDKKSYYDNALSSFRGGFTMDDRQKLKKNLKDRFSKVGKMMLAKHTTDEGKRYHKNKRTFFQKLMQNKVTKFFSRAAMNAGWTIVGARFLTNAVIRTIENELNKQGYLSYEIDDD